MGSAAWDPIPMVASDTVPDVAKRVFTLPVGGSAPRQRSVAAKVTAAGTSTDFVLTIEAEINGVWVSMALGTIDLGSIATAVVADENGLTIPAELLVAGVNFTFLDGSALYRVGIAGTVGDGAGFVQIR